MEIKQGEIVRFRSKSVIHHKRLGKKLPIASYDFENDEGFKIKFQQPHKFFTSRARTLNTIHNKRKQ
jgi:hypothetical protein